MPKHQDGQIMKAIRRLSVVSQTGATEVWIEGYTGEGLRVYRGGPADARKFRRTLATIIDSIINEASRGADGS